VSGDLLDLRSLNRATLARQLLLERSSRPVGDTVGHLVGLQAQEPLDPYTGLWARLDGFDPHHLADLITGRELVRIVVMRGTIHLVTAEDALVLRPLVQPILDKELANHRDFGPAVAGVDLAPVLASARRRLTDGPLTLTQLRQAFTEEFPDLHPGALAYACRNHLALVQVPPRGVWGRTGQVRYALIEEWLDKAPETRPEKFLDQIVLRYLAAFGPATTADVASWCRLTGLREVTERLHPQLRIFKDERGRQLLDLPDAPRPDPETPAPTRFLPQYDNLLLSHRDRERFFTGDERKALGEAAPYGGSALHDGQVVAAWLTERDKKAGRTSLIIHHLPRIPPASQDDLAGEGSRLLQFLAPDDRHDIRFRAVD
jgi:hypothetical protein